jgi:hypothetical protein
MLTLKAKQGSYRQERIVFQEFPGVKDTKFQEIKNTKPVIFKMIPS